MPEDNNVVSLNRSLGMLDGRLSSVEKEMEHFITREEINEKLDHILEVQKKQTQDIEKFMAFIERWRGVGLVIVIAGSIVTFVLTNIKNLMGFIHKD